jgi:hypothetical protein
MIFAIRSRLKCVEIPIHYRPRLGTSKITGSHWKAFRLGMRMILMIVHYRFKHVAQVSPARETVPSRAVAKSTAGD